MADTVSDFLVKRLSQWDVRRIFGYPGDNINGIIGGLARHDLKGDPDADNILRHSIRELMA